MNSIKLHDNIVRAEIKTAESGKSYLVATIASDRSTKGDSATDFFRVVSFAETLPMLNVGDFIRVVGTVRLGEYDGKRTVEIVAKRIERVVRKEMAA
jgi:single-stranded DNA-binding protein